MEPIVKEQKQVKPDGRTSPFRRIVVPCDFSEPAREAYAFSRALARKSGGSLFVLKVIDFPLLYESTFGVQPYSIDPKLLEDMEADARAKYQKMKASMGDDDVTEEFHTINGSITGGIRTFAKAHDIDLIVMGTHGANGLKEVFVGSNTEKIVRHSPVPVISVRKRHGSDSIRKIVFPIGVDYKVDAFVNRLKELQDFFDATLHAVYVITPNNFRKYTELKREIEQWIEFYALKNITLEVRSDLYEQDGIIEYAREIEADMIAMGTHGRKGLAHLLTGSIAEDVVNHMECPIWTFSLGTD